MDLDTLVNVIILFLLFLLPALIQRKKAKKKKSAPPPKPPKKRKAVKKKKGFSLFANIGEQIREYIREVEKQAKQEKQEQKTSFWDDLVKQEPRTEPAEIPSEELLDMDRLSIEPGEVSDFTEPLEAADTETETGYPEFRQKSVPEPERVRPVPGMADPERIVKQKITAGQLRQAVIWSEILGKPVGLKDT